jgi:MFS family permease
VSGAPPLVALWVGAFAFTFSFFLLMPVLPLYARDVGLSAGEIGIVTAAFAVSSMALRSWTGWAADRYGRRPFMIAGGVVFLLAPLGYGVSAGVLSLTAVRIFHGSGMAFYPTAASAMVADLAAPARRAEMLGIFGMAGSTALALGPATGIALARTFGFVPLFTIAAVVAIAALALTATAPETLRTRGTAPFRLRSTLSANAAFPSVLELGLMITYGALTTFLPLHADARGLNPGVFFLVYALALTLVRQPAGRLSDRHGRGPVAALGLFIVAAALLTVALSHGLVGLAAAGVVYGIGQGIASPALIAWCMDGVAPAERGRAMGTFYTALELGIAIGAMTSGAAVARIGFTVTFLAAAGLAAGVAVLAAHRGMRRGVVPAV